MEISSTDAFLEVFCDVLVEETNEGFKNKENAIGDFTSEDITQDLVETSPSQETLPMFVILQTRQFVVRNAKILVTSDMQLPSSTITDEHLNSEEDDISIMT